MLKIAHRGYSSMYGDNNMLSFQKAYVEGFNVIEMDIQLNAENEIVVFHDLHKNGCLIRKMDSRETKKYCILLLKDVFEEFRYSHITLYLDLKGDIHISDKLIQFIKQSQFPVSRLLIASFNKLHLLPFITSPLNVKIGFITSSHYQLNEYEILLKNIDFIVCDSSVISSLMTTWIHNMNKKIYVCTCDNIVDYEYLKDFDVDGIISNILF